MTDDQISMLKDRLTADVEAVIRELENSLRKVSHMIISKLDYHVDRIFKDNGKTRCLRCQGTGAVERLDSGYMRKFGLREWDGCESCGGDGNEVKGKGFIDAE